MLLSFCPIALAVPSVSPLFSTSDLFPLAYASGASNLIAQPAGSSMTTWRDLCGCILLLRTAQPYTNRMMTSFSFISILFQMTFHLAFQISSITSQKDLGASTMYFLDLSPLQPGTCHVPDLPFRSFYHHQEQHQYQSTHLTDQLSTN